MRIAIIAAGGNSRRTGLGDYTTKAALLLAGKPLLVHQLDFLKRSGIDRAFVVCQPKHAKLLSSLLSEEQRSRVAFLFAESAGGWGGKIERAMPFINDDDEVAIVPCDNYQTAPKIIPLNGIGYSTPALFTFTASGRKTLTDGPVFGSARNYWKEQPGHGFSGDLFTGYIFARGSTLRRSLTKVKISERGEKEITSLLSVMYEKGEVMPAKYDGTYEDIADLHALARVHAHLIGPHDFESSLARATTKTVLGAGVLLSLGDRVLLTERQDGLGWVPPGGLVDANETFAQAASRELREEIGIVVAPEKLRLLGVYPTIGKGGEAACSIIFHHHLDALPSATPDANEVLSLDWFTQEECAARVIPFDLNLAVNDHFAGKELDCR